MTDCLFIDYMTAFEAVTAHTGGCLACQNSEPCETGDPLHTRFLTLHQQWTARSSAAPTI